MKLIDVYYFYKKDYKEYVLLIRSGIFYYVYNDDCSILYHLLNYKIKYSSNCFVIGFPSNTFHKVLKKLEENHINYLVIQKDNMDDYYIEEKYKTNSNRYCEYEIDYHRLDYLNNRINDITDRLRDNIFSTDIEIVLQKMEKLI